MATDFFARQEQARTSTAWLVFLFLLAVVGIVASTVGATIAGLYWMNSKDAEFTGPMWSWELPLLVGVATLCVILLGSFTKTMMLKSGGGSGVAEGLGGRRVFPNTNDPDERRLLNVVEEMALASGTPVPPVFLLSGEKSINAFAAGYNPGDAVIGVTDGAIHSLRREQLQGVMAHEFSHILNGDMRLGIRLIGVLHGILLLGLIGRMVFRMVYFSGSSSRRSRSDKKSGGGAIIVILAVGVTLIVIGSLGALIGNLIKAAVSRQREFLADASAVQFTRNPLGLSGALKRIAALAGGSTIGHAKAAEASHLFFAQGVTGGFASWFDTHPPLTERIRALEPQWDGTIPKIEPDEVQNDRRQNDRREIVPRRRASGTGAAGFASQDSAERVAGGSPNAGQAVPALDSVALMAAIDTMGHPGDQHRRYAAELLAALPEVVADQAREPYGARAVVFAMLLDPKDDVRQVQLRALAECIESHVVELTIRLCPHVSAIEPRARLPLVDLTLPTLRCMTRPQYEAFQRCVSALVAADRRLGLFEWTLSQVVARHLGSQFGTTSPPTRYYGLQRLSQPCSVLLSTLARAGHDPQRAEHAFALGAGMLTEAQPRWLAAEQCGMQALGESLENLATTAPHLRAKILAACVACICADGTVTLAEAELLRGVADLLDCPVPPILAGQPLEPPPPM